MPIETLREAALPLAACVALTAFGFLALRKPLATAALVVGIWIATVAVRVPVDLSIVVSDARVALLDVVALVLLGAAAVRLVGRGVQSAAHGLILVLLLLLGIHIARGVGESDLQTALNSARSWLYFTATMAYAATVPRWSPGIWTLLVAGGAALAVFAVPFLLTEGLRTGSEFTLRDGVLIDARPVVATGALLVLQAAILALALRRPAGDALAYVAFGCALMAVLLQHRTIWIAAVLTGLAGLGWWIRRQPRSRHGTVFGGVGLALLLVPVGVWGLTQVGPLVESAQEVTSSNSTFSWRTTGWDQLLASNDTPSELMYGGPAGEDLTRFINGTEVTVSPHNGFIDAFLRFGLPGVGILLLLGLMVWRGRNRVARSVAVAQPVVGLLLLTQLTFSIAYSLDAVQGLIAGVLVSGLAAEAGARAPSHAPPSLVPPSRYAVP